MEEKKEGEKEGGGRGRRCHNSRLDLDVLNWWKMNSSRFPNLASITRDVLAIPVFTVASKSVFSA